MISRTTTPIRLTIRIAWLLLPFRSGRSNWVGPQAPPPSTRWTASGGGWAIVRDSRFSRGNFTPSSVLLSTAKWYRSGVERLVLDRDLLRRVARRGVPSDLDLPAAYISSVRLS